MSKKVENTAEILGIRLNSTSASSVLGFLLRSCRERKKMLLVTPNPEFLVYAHDQPWFKKILNSADLALPDGVGLVFAARFKHLGSPALRDEVVRPGRNSSKANGGEPALSRIPGSDLVAELLKEANRRGWWVGIIGVRRGVKSERIKLMGRLRDLYPQAKLAALEDTPGWQKEKWEIIFACQGMGEQEKWLVEHKDKINACIFMGIGGSLDFLGGFAHRAPTIITNLGLEWLWRVFQHPGHLSRVFTATIIFPLLVVKEKLEQMSQS